MADVVVIGAGPAGSVTGALLVRLGYRVEIWDRKKFPRFRIGESLPPRAVGLLEHLGFGQPVRDAGFAVMEGHTSIWGEDRPRRMVFQTGCGLQVERSHFDEVLLRHSGATVRFGVTATQLIREGGRVTGVRFVDDGVSSEKKARYVVVATGNRSFGKRELRLKQSAVFGYWNNSRHPQGSQANDTIIEAFPDGWVWSLRLASDLRNVTVLAPNSSLQSYKDAIGQTSLVRRLLEGAGLVADPRGCDASWFCAEQFAEPGMLLVGDAGSVIDPLSSQGVYKALCSAMSAAAVVNTCIQKPALESTALQYFNDEERRMYEGHEAGAITAFRSEQRWPERPFWKKRHDLQLPLEPAPRPFSAEIALEIEAGKADTLRLKVTEGVRVAPRPALSGPFIELADYVVSSRFDYGYRGPHAETLIELFNAFREGSCIGDVLATRNRNHGEMERKIVAYMYKEGLLGTYT